MSEALLLSLEFRDDHVFHILAQKAKYRHNAGIFS